MKPFARLERDYKCRSEGNKSVFYKKREDRLSIEIVLSERVKWTYFMC